MSQQPSIAAVVGVGAPGSEKSATSPASARTPSSASTSAPKLRSCVVCRSRKVRCDKQSPCSNCRRAKIACVFPSTDRPPRWTRRLERFTSNATSSNATASQGAKADLDKAMERLRNLENLVKELSGQLEQAHNAASSGGGGPSAGNSPGANTQDRDADHHKEDTSSVQKQFGRMVFQDASRSRYVSSGFWSRVYDELDGLKMDTRTLAGYESDSSEDETSLGNSPSTQATEQTPSERHAFLFRHNLSPSIPDLREYHPLPSQIPFLLDTFSENVNWIIQIVHVPTIRKMIRDLRGGDMTRLGPVNEALMFSIYYATIASMEEEDVITNFGCSKTDLNQKYRVGVEHALARADFLNAPDIVLVQAFTLFLCLVRRHDTPRFVWMMTGLVIRMAQYLGLQRDGTHFQNLTPFEIETRRKVWWGVCHLDLRASEDQGTDVAIATGSFDTKIPLNINDADISPDTKEMPPERDGITDMTFARIMVGSCNVTKQIMAQGTRVDAAGLEEKGRLLQEIYHNYEQEYFRHATEPGNIAYWVGVTVARLVMAKLTLVVFLPVLFSSPNENLSDEIRIKLLVAAIEVAEYNHALNSEQACRHWRWIYQTYTHWHSIVYLMIEISRRPWSSIVERAWVALHSSWLIPTPTSKDKNSRIWFPLRKLMANARKHRDAELNRLRDDPQSAAVLDMEDRNFPIPSSSGSLSTESSVDAFRERWRQLVGMSDRTSDGAQASGISGDGHFNTSIGISYTIHQADGSASANDPGHVASSQVFEGTYDGMMGQQADQMMESTNIRDQESTNTMTAPSIPALGQNVGLAYNPFDPSLMDGGTMGPGFAPWLWADADPSGEAMSSLPVDPIDVNMELDGEVNWYNWVESAGGLGWNTEPGGNGRT